MSRPVKGGDRSEKALSRTADMYVPEGSARHALIAMELVEGEDLRARLEREPLSLVDAVRIAVETAEALKAAHAEQVIHRDVKPANVMLTSDGRVKVLDFGLAQKAGATRITNSGVRMGTPAYMSPEQALGETASPRTDVWSLGVMLYEMVGGELPFKGEVELTLAYSVINEDHEPLADLRPGVPEELDDLIDVMLAKQAEHRADIDEVLARLRALQRELQDAPNAQTKTPVFKIPPRSPNLLPTRSRLKRILRRSSLRSPMAVGVAVASALLLLVLTVVPTKRSLEPSSEAEGRSRSSVTVLPISASGGGESLQVFSDGLMETLTRRLSQYEHNNEHLVVVSPSEVRRQQVQSPADALEKFGARYAVEGSLQSEGDAVRLVLTLVETATGKQLDTKVINGSRRAALRMQDESVTNLAALLDLRVSEGYADELARPRPAVPGTYMSSTSRAAATSSATTGCRTSTARSKS